MLNLRTDIILYERTIFPDLCIKEMKFREMFESRTFNGELLNASQCLSEKLLFVEASLGSLIDSYVSSRPNLFVGNDFEVIFSPGIQRNFS